MHPELAPIAFIAAASLFLPLPWHWRAGNVATLSLVFWLFVCNIIYGVDAIIWAKGVDIMALVWCDITTKLIVGANFALPAACLCICIHLEQVSSVRAAVTTLGDKRKRQIFEFVMCLGLPCIFMALHYIVQGHRFDIIESYGCRPTTYFSILSIFIVWIPPLVMSLAALIYAGLALRHFMNRRLSFSTHLNAGRSALTTSRYIRLVLMSILQMFWSISITTYDLWFTVMAIPIRPWTNWADVHSNFSRVDTFPALFTPPRVAICFYTLWWMIPASTFLFVAFFAFGKDAIEEYKKCFVWFRRTILRQSVSGEKSNKFGTLPTIRDMKPTVPSPRPMATTPSPPPYQAFTSPSSSFKRLTESQYDSRTSLYSMSTSPYSGEAIAIGSMSDLVHPTPSTAIPSTPTTAPWTPTGVLHIVPLTPFEPPSPLTPPPAHPQPRRKARNPPTSPRPITYPSHDATHRGINPPTGEIS